MASSLSFQSTLPVWGETKKVNHVRGVGVISIHPPRTGRDRSIFSSCCGTVLFQSTLPVRGETWGRWAGLTSPTNFNPPSPYGERPGVGRNCGSCGIISIHPPRTGRDRLPASRLCTCSDFNPPSPYGERHLITYRLDEIDKFQSALPARGGTSHQKRSHP